jgi:hypothetical protein
MRATSRWSVRFLAFTIGCSGGGTEIITPPPPPAAEFVLTFVPDPEESSTSAALGWQAAIPGISGTIIPADSSVPARNFTASAQGKAAFAGLTSGTYLVEAARWLTSPEKARLTPSDDALGYAGRWRVEVVSQGAATTLETPAGRRHGLVISEWAFNGYGYNFGGFIELFNNADTTIYLDGVLLVEGFNVGLAITNTFCSEVAALKSDQAGIWARSFQQFPGSGREHPLHPGEAVVIATDAIDHRPLAPRTLDLSGANFEFRGPADVDNPAVPDMIDVGITVYQHGHGATYFGLVHVPVVVAPLDVSSLPRMTGPSGSTVYARFPADRVLDAFALGTNYPPPGGFEDCPPLVHPRFERKESRVRGSDDRSEYEYSVSRRRITLPGGGTYLQWTRSGDADLVRTSRSPGAPGGL